MVFPHAEETNSILILNLVLLSSCLPEEKSDVYLCQNDRWVGSSIHLNTKTGMSRFEDVSGDLQKCKDAPICIEFPVAFHLGTWSDYRKYRKVGYSNKLTTYTEHDGAIWRYDFSENRTLKKITVKEPRYSAFTTYMPCGGEVNIRNLVKLGSNVDIRNIGL